MEEQIGGKYRMELSQTQFSLSTDSIALADFARVFSGARVCDLGCGCGALGLLLLAKCETLQVTGVEIQEPAARCAAENAAQNGLSQFSVLHGDLREYRTLLPANGFDIVVSNPPYYPVSGGAAPEKLLRDLAGRVDFWGEDLNGLNGFVDQAIVDLKNIRALGVKDAIRRAMEREI